MTAMALASTVASPPLASAPVAAVDDQHLGRDFPYPMCGVCRFPIPPWDLDSSEYEHRHANICKPAAPGAARLTSERWRS